MGKDIEEMLNRNWIMKAMTRYAAALIAPGLAEMQRIINLPENNKLILADEEKFQNRLLKIRQMNC